jgi:CBS domain-containing protein
VSAPAHPPVRDWMTTEVRTVPAALPADELERLLLREAVTGFPVVEGEALVGVVTASDLVRQLAREREAAERISPWFRDFVIRPVAEEALDDLDTDRFGALLVRDVMTRRIITIAPDQPLGEAAARMVDHHIHRILVTEARRLVGLVTSLDVARWVASLR